MFTLATKFVLCDVKHNKNEKPDVLQIGYYTSLAVHTFPVSNTAYVQKVCNEDNVCCRARAISWPTLYDTECKTNNVL